MTETMITATIVADETRRFVRAAKADGTLETHTRRSVTSAVAKSLGIEKEDLDEYKSVLKATIQEVQDEPEEDGRADSDDAKRRSSPDVESPVPRKKAKRDSSPVAAPTTGHTVPGPSEDSNKADEEAIKSESEMSVLIDEPPKRRKSKKSKGETTKTTKKPKEKTSLTPSEETIKKYKALVLACGVRKQWAKELSECATESQQISHLRRILTELGMTGRMSIEKAKRIREKRELKAEIEDVVKFEKSKGMSSTSRGSRAKAKENTAPDALTDDDSDPEPSKTESKTSKKPSAARSIMAFLADQSDED